MSGQRNPDSQRRGSDTAGAPASRMNRVLFLLALSVLINYIDRSNLSIAAPLLKDELGISASRLGILLSAFFWVYALMQMPTGWLVDRFDVKWVFAAGFFVWSAATAVTGLLHGFVALLVIRIILGFGESVTFPSTGKILGTHFTENQRGFANSMLMVGLALGPAFGILMGGSAVARFGWRPFFIVLGLAALLWLPFWVAWMPSREAANSSSQSTHEAGYLEILRQRSAWGTCIGQASINYYLYFLVTWLPFYLVRGRNFSLTEMGRTGGLVFLVSALGSAASGKLSDRWIQAGASPTTVRKGFMFVGHIGIGILFLLTVFSHGAIFIVMLALTGALLGVAVCNSWAISQMLAGKNMVGRWVGVQNFVGNVGGAVAPALTGFLLDRTGSFYWPFFITAIVAWVGGIGWQFVVGPLDEIDWSRVCRHAQEIRASSAAKPELS
jgi:MFS transporter, ACS family, D-galactonate transporter